MLDTGSGRRYVLDAGMGEGSVLVTGVGRGYVLNTGVGIGYVLNTGVCRGCVVDTSLPFPYSGLFKSFVLPLYLLLVSKDSGFQPVLHNKI